MGYALIAITPEFSVILEAKPRDNRKRESYNERITYTIVTTEITKKCGLCREKCGLRDYKPTLLTKSDKLEVT